MRSFKVKSAKWQDGALCLVPADYADKMAAVRACYETREGKAYSVEIKPYKEKRSLNANAYAWLLIGKIADAIRADKEEVYKDMLKHYGQGDTVSVRSDIKVKGLFKYYERLGESSLNGKDFTHYRVFRGSSEYDAKEMSILIDGIVQEAKNLDIETLTPIELERMKDEWAR